jgi:uncharacterized integral membrane protein
MTRLRYVSWILTIPLTLIVISFAVSNRGQILFQLWPLPEGVNLPAFLVIFGALIFGIFIGGSAAWLSSLKFRNLARRRHRQIIKLESELASLQSRCSAATEDAKVTESLPLEESSRALIKLPPTDNQ